MVSAYQLNAHKVSFWLLALTVLLLPFGLGGNRPLAFGTAQIGLGLFFLTFAFAQQPAFTLPRRIKWAAWLFFAVILWGWLQTVSFTPASWHHPLWMEGKELLPSLQGSISLTPEASHLTLFRFITYALLFIGIYIVARDPLNAARLFELFWVAGVAFCTLAVIQYYVMPDKLLWLEKWAYKGDATGPFVNRNHFADYAGLTFLVGFGLVWQSLRHALNNVKKHQRGEVLQMWVNRNALGYIPGLLIALWSLLLSHSRAGLVVTIGAVIVFIFAYLVYQRRWKSAVFMTIGIALAAAAILPEIANSGRFTTLFRDYSSLDRSHVYSLTLTAIDNNPWFGHGLGSFESAFRLYRDTGLIMGDIGFNRAHNDWLEAAFDLGIPGALALFATIILLVSGCWHGVRTRHRSGIYPALGLAASAMILTHAFVDFNMQMPGIVVTWILLLAVGLAQSWSPRKPV